MTEKLTKDQLRAAIKPLTWDEKGTYSRVNSHIDDAEITFNIWGTFNSIGRGEVCVSGLSGYMARDSEPISIGWFDSLDEAQQSAQRWYEEFVLGFMDFKEDESE